MSAAPDKAGAAGLPAWLAGPSAPAVRTERDAFAQGSLRGLFGVLGALRRADAARACSPGDAAVRVFAVLALVLLLALSRSASYVAVYGVLLLAAAATRRPAVLAACAKAVAAAAAISVPALLPAYLWGFRAAAGLLAAKALCAAGTLALLTAQTRPDRVLGALAWARVPGLALLVLDLALRYLQLLGDFSARLVEALALRSLGRLGSKRAALSGAAGVLFLRSADAARALKDAMDCRLFDGSYRSGPVRGFGAESVLWPLVLIAALAAFIYFGSFA